MAIQDKHQLAAGSVYLAIYFVLACITFFGVVTRRPNRRFLGIAIFSCIRTASQICSIGSAVVGYQNTDWLVAFFILGAEGYFTLILSCLFLCLSYQIDYFPEGSWIRPPKPSGLSPLADRLWKYKQFSFWFHFFLLVPNALVIAGGSLQANALALNATPHDYEVAERGRKMRIVGQSFFLAMTVLVLSVILHTFLRARRDAMPNLRRLGLMVIVAPCLLVRGIFGVLQAGLGHLSYYNYSNYTQNGLASHLLIAEYVAATTMEFISASAILYAIWISTKTKAAFAAEKQAQAQLESGDLDHKDSRDV